MGPGQGAVLSAVFSTSGRAPLPPWAEAHPVQSEWPACCFWQRPAFVPLTGVVLGPIQQDGVGRRLPTGPDTGCQPVRVGNGLISGRAPNSSTPHAANSGHRKKSR